MNHKLQTAVTDTMNVTRTETIHDMETKNYRFLADGKTLSTTRETDTGDLIIEGYAAVFDGIDRQGENFVDGAFLRAIREFLTRQATLAFHHRYELGIGKVLDLREVEGKGLWMRARVDYQPESSPLFYIYNGIKKGTYTALSVGGYFRRRLTADGWRIADMDFTEVSVTPVPAHPGTNFAVVAGKALSAPTDPLDWNGLYDDARLLSLKVDIVRLERDLHDIIGAR